MQTNNLNIIEGIKEGGLKRRRFEAILFSDYQYFVEQSATRYPLDETERESAYCDAFIALIKQIIQGTFREDASLKTFFYSIFSKKCVDAVRKKTTNKAQIHQHTEWLDNWIHLSSNANNALKTLIQKELVEKVQEGFTHLGEKCLAILKKSSRGYSAGEIATLFGYKNAQTVRMTKSRCVTKLLEDKSINTNLF